MIVVWFAVAVARCTPEFFNRVGAIITACAAALVVWQIAVEIGLESERHAAASRQPDGRGLSPMMTRAFARASTIMQARNEEQYRLARLRVAAFVAANAVLGELIHGFGDLLVDVVRTCVKS